MDKKGRMLEKLVASLERIIANNPEIEIKSPDYIPDKDTGEMREVDVSIRSKVGSSDVLVIIECRDRKSKQDVQWIEQIATKRKSVSASIAMAVSASGFSAPALIKAKSEGIEIRKVEEITIDEIRSWFKPMGITVSNYTYSLINVEFGFIGYEESMRPELDEVLKEFTPQKEIFFLPHLNKFCNFDTIWNFVIGERGRSEVYKDVISGGDKKRLTIQMNFTNKESRYYLINLPINYLLLVVDIWMKDILVQPSRIYTYSSPDKSVMHTLDFTFQVSGEEKTMSIHRNAETMQMAVSFGKSEGKTNDK